MKFNFSLPVKHIFEAINDRGGQIYLVGGAVRDKILFPDREIKDFDLEVYNLTSDQLKIVLEQFGQVQEIGRQFGVLKLREYPELEFALPRLEEKIGVKHQDFQVTVVPDLALKQAAARRDLTVNALMYDVNTEKLYDFYGGLDDLKHRLLRAVNRKSFPEDPLRVLRTARFCAQLDFSVDVKTKHLCQRMVQKGMMQGLSSERVYDEYSKILMTNRPSLGFDFLRSIKALPPCIQILEETIQNQLYHPEGNVFKHTMLVLDLSALCKHKTSNPLAFMWGMLLHDIGKPPVTTPEGHAKGHNLAGVKVFDAELLDLITNRKMQAYIRVVIKYHMDLFNMYRRNAGDYAYYRLLHGLRGVMPIEDMILVNKCDKLGRYIDNHENVVKMDEYIQEKIRRLGHDLPQPLITGKDLIKLGYQESREFREILDWAYSYQKRGHHDKKEILRLIEAKKYEDE